MPYRDATQEELANEPVPALEAMARGDLGVSPATAQAAAAELRSRRDAMDVTVTSEHTLQAMIDARVGEVSETTRILARAELDRRLLGETTGKTEA